MTKQNTTPTAIVMVSNGISAAMARKALAHDGYLHSQVALVKMREFEIDWDQECNEIVNYGGSPSSTLIGQVRFMRFYRTAAAKVRDWLRSGAVRDIYIPNIDNLISNDVVRRAQRGLLPGGPRISILAEGFMNYQEINCADRAAWRWLVKPAIAFSLGLKYRRPQGHLSGSMEVGVSRVFSYSAIGLKAPPEKVVEIPFPKIEPKVKTVPNTVLIVLTGISQWMEAKRFELFRSAFVSFVQSQGFDRILVKRHPFYDAGGIEYMIQGAELIDDRRRLEEMADILTCSTVVGYCSTSLVVLKLLRPDLRIIDWGSNFYCKYAYHDDYSIVDVLKSASVEIVRMEDA